MRGEDTTLSVREDTTLSVREERAPHQLCEGNGGSSRAGPACDLLQGLGQDHQHAAPLIAPDITGNAYHRIADDVH